MTHNSIIPVVPRNAYISLSTGCSCQAFVVIVQIVGIIQQNHATGPLVKDLCIISIY